jgi:hypothetical protein
MKKSTKFSAALLGVAIVISPIVKLREAFAVVFVK